MGRHYRRLALIALVACGLLIVLATTAAGRGQPPTLDILAGPTEPYLVLIPGRARAKSTRPMTEEDRVDLLAAVLADTEDTWHALFEDFGETYREPTLVLCSDQIPTACGEAQAAASPVYCMLDQRIYIDPGFYGDLRDRFGAPGDAALAYLLAREVGHHVQMLLGISAEIRAARQQLPEVEANQLSVMQELQADCFAGVWAHHAHEAHNLLGEKDVKEALNAASAIGDDRLKRQRLGYGVPDVIPHGTSEQRVRWFRKGLRPGPQIAPGMTFDGTMPVDPNRASFHYDDRQPPPTPEG